MTLQRMYVGIPNFGPVCFWVHLNVSTLKNGGHRANNFFVMRSASETVPQLGSFHEHDDDKGLLISCARLQTQVRSFLNPIRYLQKPPPQIRCSTDLPYDMM
jgi:hypothetical protein